MIRYDSEEKWDNDREEHCCHFFLNGRIYKDEEENYIDICQGEKISDMGEKRKMFRDMKAVEMKNE